MFTNKKRFNDLERQIKRCIRNFDRQTLLRDISIQELCLELELFGDGCSEIEVCIALGYLVGRDEIVIVTPLITPEGGLQLKHKTGVYLKDHRW